MTAGKWGIENEWSLNLVKPDFLVISGRKKLHAPNVTNVSNSSVSPNLIANLIVICIL